MTTDTEAVKTTVDPDTKRQIRVEAAKRDMSMAELARGALEAWVDENVEN